MSNHVLYEHNDDGDYLLTIQECRQQTDDPAYAGRIEVSIDGRTCCLPADARREVAQAVAGDEWGVIPAAEAAEPHGVGHWRREMQRVLNQLGIEDGIGRRRNPADIVDVIRVGIDRIKQATSIPDWERELLSQPRPAQPDRPEPVDPASVRKGEYVSIEFMRETGGLPRFRVDSVVEEVHSYNAPHSLTIRDENGEDWQPDLTDATVRILRAAEHVPDPAAVDALRQVMRDTFRVGSSPGVELDEEWIERHARELAKRNVRVVSRDE